jgi:dTDP-glucose pyrophosphorylase
MNEQNIDGGILIFTADNPKWSFVKTNNLGYVTEVAEKNPISNQATVGVYYWSKGSNYVSCAESMISKNIRVNNEFYVCPVYNESILNGDKIKTYSVKNMCGLGTPEDLDNFINLRK